MLCVWLDGQFLFDSSSVKILSKSKNRLKIGQDPPIDVFSVRAGRETVNPLTLLGQNV